MKKKWGMSFSKMKLKYEERSGRDFREEAHTQVHYGIKKYKRCNSRGIKKWFNTILKMHGKNLNKFHALKWNIKKMDEEDRELLREHSRLKKELQEDFQKLYKVIKQILPEIERTETVKRLDQERDKFKKKHPELFEWS
jgi:DNA-directed RNA polymerase subunit H (RpoH/RPB5)